MQKICVYKTGLDAGGGLSCVNPANSVYYTRSIPIRGASRIWLSYWIQSVTSTGTTPLLQITPGFTAPPGASFTGNTVTTPRLDAFASDSYNETLTDLSINVSQTTNAHASAIALAATASPVSGLWVPQTNGIPAFPSQFCRFKVTLSNAGGTTTFSFGLFRVYVYYADSSVQFVDQTSAGSNEYVSAGF